MTASGDLQIRKGELAAHGYLKKPFIDIAGLLQAITHYLI
jgi:hypothetical protein